MGEVEAHDSHSSMDEFLQDGKLLGSGADGRHDLGERPMTVVGGHGVDFVIAVEPNGGLEGWDGPCRDGGEGRCRNGPALARSGGKEIAAPDCRRSAAGDGDGSTDHLWWWLVPKKRYMHALAANANETMGRGENEEQSDGQTKKKTQHKKHIILHDAPRRMPALRLIFANSNDDVETKHRGSMLPCTDGSYCQCGSSMQRLSVSPPAAIHHTSSSSPDLAAAAVAVGHGW